MNMERSRDNRARRHSTGTRNGISAEQTGRKHELFAVLSYARFDWQEPVKCSVCKVCVARFWRRDAVNAT